MERKIIKIGNSLGIVIPSKLLSQLDISQDDIVEIEFDKNLNMITIKNKSTTPDDSSFEAYIKSIVDQYLKDKGL